MCRVKKTHGPHAQSSSLRPLSKRQDSPLHRWSPSGCSEMTPKEGSHPFLLAAPIVFVMSLLILAASNIAFSLLYTRSQASASRQLYTAQHRTTTPGQAARATFHSLRPAYFTRPTAWGHIEKRRQQEQAAKYRKPIADTMPHLSEALDSVVELVMRDYVSGWMRAITPEVVLQQRIEELLRIVLIRLKVRVMDLDLTQLLVIRLVPKVTSHVNDFRKAEMALRGNSLERALTESDELDIMVASKFRQGKLHRALSTSVSTTASEEAYLRNVVQTILPTLLPKSEVQSEILRHLVRELLVGAVLRPVMDLLSDPDYWNQNVDLYTGKAIREQNMVKKLREALKQHTDNMDTNSRVIENPSDPYGTGADLYSFEDFLRMIRRCDSLLDVKRIRNAIMTQIRKKKALIVNREKDDVVNGNKVEDIIVYINRLDIARRHAEKRIEALGGPAYPKRRTRDSAPESKSTPTEITLETILTNPSGLSYFMEFLDRRDNMSELQFWLLIDTLNIKSDTESNEGSSINSDMDSKRSNNGMSNSTSASTLASGQKSAPDCQPPPSIDNSNIRNSRKNSVATTVDDVTDTLREDVHMIYDTYFADTAPRPVDISHSLVKAFQEFAFGDHGSAKSASSIASNIEIKRREESKAAQIRQQLLIAQRQVFDQMSSRDFPEFSKTDLYFKFMASYQNSIHEPKDDDGSPSQPGHQRQTSNSNSRSTLFSGIGLSSSDKRLNSPENPKRSSTGSFLDIFGLGRDKDKDHKEREREHQKSNRRSGPPGTPSFAHSKSISPITGRPRDFPVPKPVPTSTLRPGPSSLGRSRSMSSISNPELPNASSNRTSAAAHDRNISLDLAEPEVIDKDAVANDALGDSLLRELQEQDDDELDGLDGGKTGLKIPKMPKSKRKDNVIDAVEAALSSIMETHSQDDLGLKEKDKPIDPTDPAFSTARDNPDDMAFMEWGKSQEKAGRRFKEKGLDDGKAIRAKSRDPSDLGQKTLSSIFSNEKQTTSSRPLSQTLISGSENGGEKLSPSDTPKLSSGKIIAGTEETAQDNVHLAAPGDLLLATRITKLEQDIETVRKQESIVETLIRKAERQGRQEELRILNKSKSALRREILSMEYQKTQYEVQEEENMIMPGRSSISITSSTLGHDGSKEFALYVIEVHQMAQDGSFASGWVIARRYSEFFALHQQLKEKFAVVRQYELPGKRGFLKLQKSFVEGRRIGLEKYLRLLVQHSDICQSQELRAFLSQENIALPQFSAPPPLPLLYSLFEQSSDISASASANDLSNQPQHQHFFENLFHSASSPSSPIMTREPSSQFGSNSVHEDRKRDSTSSLEPEEGFMKHIYQTVSEGLDDMFSGGPPTVLGNITKQLGNQMMQFSMEADEEDAKVDGQGNQDSVGKGVGLRVTDSLASPSPSKGLMSMTQSAVDLQRPALNRVHSARSRRLSSPDPHTQHQKQQLKRQEQQRSNKLQQQENVRQPHLQPPQQLRPVVEPEGVTTFTEPLCDLFIELFELKEKNNWLRRQAVVIILQQVLGGTIERKLRDTIKAYFEESMLTFYVIKLRDALWPSTESPSASMEGLSGGFEVIGDTRSPPTSARQQEDPEASSSSATKKKPSRTAEQKAMTKEQANRKLSVFLPELLGNMVGHQNARRGARRVFAAFQNRRLNQQLVYTTLDEIILAMWPELGLDAGGDEMSGSVGQSTLMSTDSK